MPDVVGSPRSPAVDSSMSNSDASTTSFASQSGYVAGLNLVVNLSFYLLQHHQSSPHLIIYGLLTSYSSSSSTAKDGYSDSFFILL
jgi:hypothetical protein